MTYFANINESNTVIQVIVASNAEGLPGIWIEASNDGSITKNYPGIGYTWDALLNGFIAPKPYSSWLLNTNTCEWEAPVPYPTDGLWYQWDETIVNWVLVSIG